MFDDPLDKYFDVPAPAPKETGKPKPMDRAAAEALGYKPLLDVAPEIEPCQFGYPCNDCGFCH